MEKYYLDNYKNMLDPDRLPNIMTKRWDPLIPVKKNKLWKPHKVRDFVLESHVLKKLINDVSFPFQIKID